MGVPVVFIIFNRPDLAQVTFEEIRKARPPKLLVIADGPRNDEEASLCAETRAIINGVDWPCEVQTHYSQENLGCEVRVSSGLTWAFTQVEEAIILEDDCVPDPSFFPFCQEMLERYKNEDKVMMVSGNDARVREEKENRVTISKDISIDSSYYFTEIPHIWGWATWRRAWSQYDPNFTGWRDGLRDVVLEPILNKNYWAKNFDASYDKKVNSWAIRWVFSMFKKRGLSISPAVNLVQNVGFDSRAVHTKNENHHCKFILRAPLSFPLVHPQDITVSPAIKI